MHKRDFYSNFFVLRLVYGATLKDDLKSVVPRLLLVFGGLWTIGAIITLLDHTFIIDPGMGYGEDIPNYFFFVSFFISAFLLDKLVEKFIVTFNGQLGDFMRDTGLLASVSFGSGVKDNHSYEDDFKALVAGKVDNVSARNKARKFYVVMWIIILGVYLWSSVYVPLFTDEVRGNWNFSIEQHFASYLFNQLKDAFTFLILVPALLWQTIALAVSTIQIVGKIQKDKRFVLNPLAPDNAGGLKQLGEISLYLFYIAIAPMLHLFATSLVLGFPINEQALYPPYFVFAVFVFFFPLIAVRRSMQEAKRSALERISGLVRSRSMDLDKLMEGSDPAFEERKSIKTDILDLRELYKEVNRMPIWPYDFATLIRFLSGFAIPFAAFVVQTTISNESIISVVYSYISSLVSGATGVGR